jgi:tetratricopeptide (TPR) repeat protein
MAIYDTIFDQFFLFFKNSHDLNEAGINFFNNGKYAEAILCFNKSLMQNPGDSKSWYNKGLVLKKIGNYDEALFCYDQALMINPNFLSALNSKANLLSLCGIYQKARECYDKILDEDPAYSDAMWNKGLLLKTLGFDNEARLCFENWQNITPRRISDIKQFTADLKTNRIENGYITIQFPFTLKGNSGYIGLTVCEQIYYEIIKKLPLRLVNGFDQVFYLTLLQHDEQKKELKSLVNSIKNVGSRNQYDDLRIATSLVQQIPYGKIKNYQERRFYPYEVLYNQCGVCEDKSILLAFLLKELGYGVVLLEFEVERHMAVGIKVPEEFSYKKTGYAFVETTKPNIISDCHCDYVNTGKLTSAPSIIPVSDGKTFHGVQEEYRDAEEWNDILSRGQVLDQSHFSRFQYLVNKYGMTKKISH